MLPNEAKHLINNICSMVESDGLRVPVSYLNEGMKSLIYNIPLDSSISRCIESAGKSMSEEREQREETPLRNNSLAIYTPKQLALYDAALSFFRLLELEQVPLPSTFDAEHLKKIHNVIFSDIFKNAGEFRRHNARLRANEFIAPQSVPGSVDSLFSLITSEKCDMLKNNEAAMRISYYMHELYVIHPFSEGNGRVARVFFRQFADSMGYRLNYNKVSGMTLRGAEMLAFQSANLQPLYMLVNKCLSPI